MIFIFLVTTIPSQSIDLLAKILRKLAANSTSLIARSQMLKTFHGTNLDKLNNFPFQCQLYFYTNSAQFTTDAAKVNFAMTYLTLNNLWMKTDNKIATYKIEFIRYIF